MEDGRCSTREDDIGSHVVCARMADEFPKFSLLRGNDLITPRPQYRFKGLKAGDRWCLCALRWKEVLTRALDVVTLQQLQSCASSP